MALIHNIPDKVGEKYKKNILGFPSDDINPEKKDKEWHLQVGNAILSRYFGDKCYISNQRLSEILTLRAYGKGLQDTSQYQSRLQPNGKNNGGNNQQAKEYLRKGYMNIKYDPISPLPKIKNILTEKFRGESFEAICYCTDEKSIVEKDAEINKLLIEKYTAPIDKAAQEATGEPYIPPDYIPENETELKLIKMSGGIKLAREIATEQVINAALQESQYDDVVQDKINSDLIDIGMAAVKTETDPTTGRPRARYVDVAYFIAPFSDETEYTFLPWAGELRKYQIKQLRLWFGDEVTENEWLQIASMYNNQFGNPNLFNQNFTGNGYTLDNYFDRSTNTYRYDDFWVAVLDFEYQSVDTEKYTSKKDRDGRERLYKENFEEPQTTGEGKLINGRNIFYYGGKLVIGTKYIFDIGKVFNLAVDKGKERPMGSYSVFRIQGTAITQTFMPFVDQLSLTFYKLQNALAQSRPDGLSVNLTAVRNILKSQNGKISWEDVVKAAQQGVYLHEEEDKVLPGGQKRRSSSRPFEKIQGGIGAYLQELTFLVQFFESFAQRMSGINDVAAANTPKADTGLGTTELAFEATDNALKPYFQASMRIKQLTSKALCYKIQSLAVVNPEGFKAYYNIIGGESMEIIKYTAKEALSTYGIGIRIRPTQRMKEELLMAAREAMTVGRNGISLLTYGEYFFIQRMLENGGNLKYVQNVIDFFAKQKEEKAQANQEKNIVLQNEELRKTAQVTTQIEVEKDAAKINSEANKEVYVKFMEALFNAVTTTPELQQSFNQTIQKLNTGQPVVPPTATNPIPPQPTEQPQAMPPMQ